MSCAKWYVVFGLFLALLGVSPQAQAFLFITNGTDGSVVLLREGTDIWYVKCPRSVLSVESAQGVEALAARTRCQTATSHKGFSVPEAVFLPRLSALFGVPSTLFGKDTGTSALLDLAMQEERAFRARDTKKGESDWFGRLSLVHQEVMDRLGPEQHGELDPDSYPESGYHSAVINAFTPTFFDGERTFKIARPEKLSDAATACYPSWGYASLNTVMETLGGPSGAAFLDWVKESLGVSPNTITSIAAWQTYFEPKATQAGTGAYVHSHGPYVVPLNKSALSDYALIQQYFASNAEQSFLNPTAAPGYQKVFQAAPVNSPAYPVLCVRRVGLTEPRGNESTAGPLTFAVLAARYGVSEEELYRYLLTDGKLARELEPVRAKRASLSEVQAAAVMSRFDKLMPSNFPHYAQVEAAEAKARAEAKEQARLAEIQRQKEEREATIRLIAQYRRLDKAADAQLSKFRDGDDDDTVLTVCSNISSHYIKVLVAIHWAGEIGYSVYGQWSVPTEEGNRCSNVYVGKYLNPGSVYYHAWVDGGSTVWGDGTKTLLTRKFNDSTVAQADTRAPLQNGEEYRKFSAWPMEKYRRKHVINLDVD